MIMKFDYQHKKNAVFLTFFFLPKIDLFINLCELISIIISNYLLVFKE